MKKLISGLMIAASFGASAMETIEYKANGCDITQLNNTNYNYVTAEGQTQYHVGQGDQRFNFGFNNKTGEVTRFTGCPESLVAVAGLEQDENNHIFRASCTDTEGSEKMEFEAVISKQDGKISEVSSLYELHIRMGGFRLPFTATESEINCLND
ncbi:MAG: hypothetical protein CME64_17630 [Halobacteriovoraceae bacterium]|nr:hypothetical protein [Halobacteriovoraceae bacterium]|tara:strand:- start:27013 stop:27474 length:462 start_codon:yes stop_codon:yes gene_type:complete